jgi:pimeloyl-ACP methyl ester carboxylesterase
MVAQMRRAFADTPDGQIHYVEAGGGRAVLLLHQTPRSCDEYRDVIPILAKEFHVIAMDTIGYGNSYKPAKICRIEDYARGAVDLLDALGVRLTIVVGHHTGAVIGIELAASYPDRVERLVISSSPFVDAEERERRKVWKPIDLVEVREDGSHLTELWNRRLAFYPKNRPELLTRFVTDALRAGQDKMEEGHQACSVYEMEKKLPLIRCPTFVTCGTDDPFSYPNMHKFTAAIPGSKSLPIEGGTVAMVDQMPEQFTATILPFLKGRRIAHAP